MKLIKLFGVCLLAITALTFASCRGGISTTSIWARIMPDAVDGAIPLPNGVFAGVGHGYMGDIHVEVTIENNAIAEIRVVEHSDTPAFANSVFEGLIPVILHTNSTNVDGIAGATHTADGLIDAISSIINVPDGVFPGFGHAYMGPINIEVTTEGGAIVAIDVIQHQDTPAFANSVFDGLIPVILALNSTNVDSIAGATHTADGLIEAVNDAIVRAIGGTMVSAAGGHGGQAPAGTAGHDAPAPAQPAQAAPVNSFTAGTFNTSAPGYAMHNYELGNEDYDNVPVSVTVVFDSTSIVSITVTDHGETQMFAGMAFGEMIPAMLAAQTYDVDTVASATYSSQALREAVRLAIVQAQN